MNQKADRVVDLHSAPEIFCDGALAISARQDVLRLTLFSDRVDADDGKTVNRVVVGQLLLPPAGFVTLYNQMTALMQHLVQSGKLRTVEEPSEQKS